MYLTAGRLNWIWRALAFLPRCQRQESWVFGSAPAGS